MRAFITTRDMEVAKLLVLLLDQFGIAAFWVGEEYGAKLSNVWEVSAWIRDATPPSIEPN